MTSRLGTVLPRKPVAWFWFIVTAIPAAYTASSAVANNESWWLPSILGGLAALILFEPRLRKTEKETVQVDEMGVLRSDGEVHEEVKWSEITEIKILTTSGGPYQEDVFFVLAGSDGKGCLIPHEAAVRTGLLEALQAHFPSLDNNQVIKAMGCTSNNNFLLWKKSENAAA